MTLHGDHVGHGFSRAPWTALAVDYEPGRGDTGPSARGDAACRQLPDEIGVEEDVDSHVAIVAWEGVR